MPLTRFLFTALGFAALAAHAAHGQTTLYWTGNGDRWGASPHTQWSQSFARSDYFQVTAGAALHMHYNLNHMEGTNRSVLMNRQDVAVHSLILTGTGTEGFTFETVGANSNGIRMAGPLATLRGPHRFDNAGGNVLGLASDSTWNIASGSSLAWNIPLDEDVPGRSLTKRGGGTLRMSGHYAYTGPTRIHAGAFGVADGPASFAGGLVMGPDTRLLFDPVHTLTVAGGVTFEGPFGITDLEGLDASVPSGSHLLIAGPVDTANLRNTGPFAAAFLADGRRAYFTTEDGLRLHIAEDFPDWPQPFLDLLGFDEGRPVLGLDGVPGLPYNLEVSANLAQWQTAEILNGPVDWTDPTAMGSTPRFYRAKVEDARPAPAAHPFPAHRAQNVSLTPILSWSAQGGVTSHEVYFGTDRPGAFMGNQTGTTFAPGALLPNTTYYWRIDQRNASGLTIGEVWSFSTPARPSGVTYLGAGAPAASTGPIMPPLPSGLLPGDILILFLQTSAPRIYVENTNGGVWRSLARGVASPQSVGTGNDEVHLTAYYSRYNGTQGAPGTNDSGDHQLGVILAFRGVVAKGVPWDTADGNRRAEMTTSAFTPGATTSVPNTLVVGAIATALPDANGTNNFFGWNNTDGMTNLIERVDVSTSAGNGGALGIATADFAPAGRSYGRMRVTLAVPSYKAMLSAALRPEVPPGLIEEAWPHPGASGVGTTAHLRWAPSPNAATREVYFGTTSPGEYRGSQTGHTFDPGPLLPHTTYYWRVDEKNAADTTPGIVRSFTTGPAGALPQLVGMTAGNATAELAARGARVGTVERVFSDTVPPGVVMSQSLPAGTPLLPSMAIDLVRSRGPEAGVGVFPNGPDFLPDGGAVPVHRCVSLVTSHEGTLLAFTEYRPNSKDDEDTMEIHLRRSTDGGETWGPVIVVAGDGMNRCANQLPVVLPSGRILMLWLWNAWIPSESDRTTRETMITWSDDDGLTWAPHVNITASVQLPDWRWGGAGPGHGFVKKRAPAAGRIIFPMRHGRRGAPSRAHIIYSDDGGETFHIGGIMTRGNESIACEQSDGDILFNARLPSIDHRWVGLSSDGGLSFPHEYIDEQLPGAGACQASLLEHSLNPVTGKANILFSNPDDLYERINGTIKLSEHDGDLGTWTRKFRYSAPAPAFSGYSDITVMNEAGDIGIVWEFGSHYSKPERWDGGVKFRAIRFDQIDEPIP
ncbi:MAG: exo-alpha-sialidase [Opitutales bacterium]|nr:exo-alpha-sialidase [Opitutales bacterium]